MTDKPYRMTKIQVNNNANEIKRETDNEFAKVCVDRLTEHITALEAENAELRARLQPSDCQACNGLGYPNERITTASAGLGGSDVDRGDPCPKCNGTGKQPSGDHAELVERLKKLKIPDNEYVYPDEFVTAFAAILPDIIAALSTPEEKGMRIEWCCKPFRNKVITGSYTMWIYNGSAVIGHNDYESRYKQIKDGKGMFFDTCPHCNAPIRIKGPGKEATE